MRECILVIEPANDEQRSTLLHNAFEAEIHYVRRVTTIEALRAASEEYQEYQIIAFCGDCEDQCIALSKELVKEEAFHSRPILFVGQNIDELEGILGEYFKHMTCLALPIEAADLRTAARRIFRHATFWSKPPAQILFRETARVDVTMALSREHDAVGHSRLQSLNDLSRTTVPCGGEGYPHVESLEQLYEQNVIPARDSLNNFFKTRYQNLSSNLQSQLARTTYIASQAATALELSPSDKELLLASTILKGSAGIHTQILEVAQGEDTALAEAHTAFAECLKEAALVSSVDLGDEEVATELKELAESLSTAESETPLMRGSIVLASHLIDSWCFERRHWNAPGAYQLLRKLKHGGGKQLPDNVWAFTVRFLTEAIGQRKNFVQLPRELRLDPGLLAEKMRVGEQAPAAGESEVPLPKLISGMKLAKPLHTVDGELILHEGLELDDDLIWRIWQLSAIRPLHTPIVYR